MPQAPELLGQLARWYDGQPAVLRLWAVRPPALDAALRVLIVLQPWPDGDETRAAWMAHGAAWQRDLQQHLPCAVQLECLDVSFVDAAGQGTLLAEFSWRDATRAAA